MKLFGTAGTLSHIFNAHSQLVSGLGGTIGIVALGGALAITGVLPVAVACAFTASGVSTFLFIQNKKGTVGPR